MSSERCVWVIMNSDYTTRAQEQKSLKYQQMKTVCRLIAKIIIVESKWMTLLMHIMLEKHILDYFLERYILE